MATTQKNKNTGSGGSKKSTRKNKRAKTPSSGAAIRTFPSAVKALLSRPNVEQLRPARITTDTFKLDRMAALLAALGNPQQDLHAVHIAGTIGKGSTVAMMQSMLRGCGWTTGTYTSPHLIDIRERIAINGEPISTSAFTELTRQVTKAADEASLDVSFFELVTAMSWLHFVEEATDIAIIETGLGGRLDATNLIVPSVSLITKIEFDHQHLLGNTLGEIAREKAGIFKPGIPALSVKQAPEVEAVLREVAEEVGTELRIIGKDIDFSSRFCVTDDLGAHMRVCLLGDRTHYMHLPVPLSGSHQADNCALALAAMDMLGNGAEEFKESSIFRGLATTKNPGRMDMIWKQPRVLVDGAHNPASMQALMKGIGSHVQFDSMICIFGCNADKDVEANLKALSLGGDKIIFTKASDQPRAAEPEDLAKKFEKLSGRLCQTAGSIREAISIASQATGREDLICVTGSFYLVGETMAMFEQIKAARAK
jgi:dihydrofolate synthase/folylpolyglutamate synthase